MPGDSKSSTDVHTDTDWEGGTLMRASRSATILFFATVIVLVGLTGSGEKTWAGSVGICNTDSAKNQAEARHMLKQDMIEMLKVQKNLLERARREQEDLKKATDKHEIESDKKKWQDDMKYVKDYQDRINNDRERISHIDDQIGKDPFDLDNWTIDNLQNEVKRLQQQVGSTFAPR